MEQESGNYLQELLMRYVELVSLILFRAKLTILRKMIIVVVMVVILIVMIIMKKIWKLITVYNYSESYAYGISAPMNLFLSAGGRYMWCSSSRSKRRDGSKLSFWHVSIGLSAVHSIWCLFIFLLLQIDAKFVEILAFRYAFSKNHWGPLYVIVDSIKLCIL